MKIIVAPRLLIKSALERTNALSLAGGTAPIRESCPNETLGMKRAAAPKRSGGIGTHGNTRIPSFLPYVD